MGFFLRNIGTVFALVSFSCQANVSFGVRAGAGVGILSIASSFSFNQSYKAGYNAVSGLEGGAFLSSAQDATGMAASSVDERDANGDFVGGANQRASRADYLLYHRMPARVFDPAVAGLVDLNADAREDWLFSGRNSVFAMDVADQEVLSNQDVDKSSVFAFASLRGHVRYSAGRGFADVWAEGRYGVPSKVNFGQVDLFCDRSPAVLYQMLAPHPIQSVGYRSFGFKMMSAKLESSVREYFRLGVSAGFKLFPSFSLSASLGVSRVEHKVSLSDVHMGFPYASSVYVESRVFDAGTNRFWMESSAIEYSQKIWCPVFGLEASLSCGTQRFSFSGEFLFSPKKEYASDVQSVSNPCSVSRDYVRDSVIDGFSMTHVPVLESKFLGVSRIKMFSFAVTYSFCF